MCSDCQIGTYDRSGLQKESTIPRALFLLHTAKPDQRAASPIWQVSRGKSQHLMGSPSGFLCLLQEYLKSVAILLSTSDRKNETINRTREREPEGSGFQK
ncbi:uncharacterized protein TERG_00861 [Trichophyton rubrum CBS 118892]|uniref:Uncharacterized protein n=1 Tax=Trichophyton rubrum (strain ATCC MYA-4607 / CBS 118892) TaxID=559305 RepID=F2SDK4_TRIRC|nr:uncharacterized protein TERG_00861 [Trichophyton rubrum CBS 118892]EGD84584.2 hypothetical protein TERG_00861 [Trichophyton rubrum CBS 118892]